ncbi:MAG TPA: energy transducer TonB [Candidatus Krumholzibacteria bacterium]|nr:energy transducer TonB [Candidatus Krumholzibacteria bacterium]HPD71889.1 energy transducer TonB [Candidatus Krumholzibacteria bacterium]HRY41178.1 energy transducer TonB [Candidatus Krumholzibacteria bacterium]
MTRRGFLASRGAYSLAGAVRLPLAGDDHPLRKQAARDLACAAAISVALGLLAFFGWQRWSVRGDGAVAAREVRIVRSTELGVPPSIDRERPGVAAPRVSVTPPPPVAAPEPVADEVAVEPTIMTRQEVAEVRSAASAASAAGAGTAGGPAGSKGASIPAVVEAPVARAPVRVLPVKVSMKPPEYPEAARLAGVEGTVVLHVHVDEQGRVRDVKVVEGPELLRDPAIAAARTAIFRPATSDDRPIAVWVAMPVSFQLRGR